LDTDVRWSVQVVLVFAPFGYVDVSYSYSCGLFFCGWRLVSAVAPSSASVIRRSSTLLGLRRAWRTGWMGDGCLLVFYYFFDSDFHPSIFGAGGSGPLVPVLILDSLFVLSRGALLARAMSLVLAERDLEGRPEARGLCRRSPMLLPCSPRRPQALAALVPPTSHRPSSIVIVFCFSIDQTWGGGGGGVVCTSDGHRE